MIRMIPTTIVFFAVSVFGQGPPPSLDEIPRCHTCSDCQGVPVGLFDQQIRPRQFANCEFDNGFIAFLSDGARDAEFASRTRTVVVGESAFENSTVEAVFLIVPGFSITSTLTEGNDGRLVIMENAFRNASELNTLFMIDATSNIINDYPLQFCAPEKGVLVEGEDSIGTVDEFGYAVHPSAFSGTIFQYLPIKRSFVFSTEPLLLAWFYELIAGFELCPGGYHQDQSFECIPNVCTCDNGEPSTGFDCEQPNGNQNCASCNEGFVLVGGACVIDYCGSGIVGGEHPDRVCCPAECGTCGGSGCAGRPGGSDCCVRQLKEQGRSCDGAGDVSCTIPDIDECELGASECDPNAECINDRTALAGGAFATQPYGCFCNEGFSGDGFTCTDIDECLEENACVENANCVNSPGSYSCVCALGYIGDGTTCVDEDECGGLSPCGENAVCKNADGTYSCECASGFTGDPYDACVDLDECKTETDSCNPAGTSNCVNTEGSFTCACEPGYGDDTCADLNECALSTDNCSPSSTACINTDGSFTCACKTGYENNTGTSCAFINYCVKNPCESSFVCQPYPGGRNCMCPPPKVVIEGTCMDKPLCYTNLISSDVCCPQSCGKCGGSGCSGRPGGSENCCVRAIRNSKNECQNWDDTACIIPPS